MATVEGIPGAVTACDKPAALSCLACDGGSCHSLQLRAACELQVLQPAIELAEDGFPVSPVTAHQWRGCFSQLTRAGSPGVSPAASCEETYRSGTLFLCA
jgi:Gamma-glutamyltranspeptidase